MNTLVHVFKRYPCPEYDNMVQYIPVGILRLLGGRLQGLQGALGTPTDPLRT